MEIVEKTTWQTVFPATTLDYAVNELTNIRSLPIEDCTHRNWAKKKTHLNHTMDCRRIS